MLDIKLTKIEYANSWIHAYFDLDGQALPRASLSGKVVFPGSPSDPPQRGTERQAHAQLLEHLEQFVQELREILKE